MYKSPVDAVHGDGSEWIQRDYITRVQGLNTNFIHICGIPNFFSSEVKNFSDGDFSRF